MLQRLKSMLAALIAAGPIPASAAPGTPAKQSAGRPRLAFVLLGDEAMPTASAVIAALRRIAPAGEFDETEPPSWTPETATFTFGKSGVLGIGLMPRPVPKQEAEWHAERSLAAARAGWKLPPHRAHLTVFWQETMRAPVVVSIKRFTWLLAAVTEASHGLAVYWGDSGATHPGAYFTEVAKSSPELMVTLWSGLSVAADAGNPQRMSIVSLGMSQFDLPDLELTVPRSIGKDEALDLFYRFLTYVLERGAPIREGETIGRTEQERLKVRYVRSPVDPKKKVWRVDLPDV
jgi:uncharacterized protein DUF4261